MRRASAFRYFLCFLPDEPVRDAIASIHRLTGQGENRVPVERSHLSLCVFGAPPERDPFVARRVEAALAGLELPSCVIRLGRVRGGPSGATLFTRGSKRELTALRRGLLERLAARGVVPELEKSNPHVTLGYDPFRGSAFGMRLEWIPREVVLIESEHGLGRHNSLARWPLLPPVQGLLPLSGPLAGLRLAS
jgi:2'-5' RNA ligase